MRSVVLLSFDNPMYDITRDDIFTIIQNKPKNINLHTIIVIFFLKHTLQTIVIHDKIYTLLLTLIFIRNSFFENSVFLLIRQLFNPRRSDF